MKKISIVLLVIIVLIITITYIIYNIYIRIDIKKSNNESKVTKEKIISKDLRIGITNFDTVNPIISENTNVQNISRLIYEPLLNLTYDYKLEECLATEWKKIDENSYIIKLRRNVKWQDGKEFDADDVVYTVNIINELKDKSIYYNNVYNIKQIKKIDKHTIKIYTFEERPYFEYNLIFPILSSKKQNKNTPVGTGMYYIEEINKQNINLESNSNWWNNNDIKINNINIKFYKNINEEIEDIELNKLDLIATSAKDVNEFIDSSKCNIKKYIGRNYNYIVINCDNKLLKNKKLRQAINYGINKNEIIEKVYKNNYVKSEFPLDYGCYLYKRGDEDNYSREKALKILKDNKIKNITIDLLVNKNQEDKIKVASLIKEQLNDIGIKINTIEKSDKKFEQALESKKYELAIIDNMYELSPDINKYFEKNNLSNYDNNQAIRILKKIESNSEEEAKKNIEIIKEYYNKDIPFISLYYDTCNFIYSRNLRGKISPNSYNIFYNIEDWYREYDK